MSEIPVRYIGLHFKDNLLLMPSATYLACDRVTGLVEIFCIQHSITQYKCSYFLDGLQPVHT